MYSAIVSLPRSSATDAQAVLTEFVSASVSVIWPKSSPPKLSSGVPEITLPFSPSTGRVRVVLAAVERRRGGDDLHRRAGREAALGGAVEGLGVGRVARVVAGVGGHHAHGAGLDVERHDGPVAAAQALEGDLLGLGIEASCAGRRRRRAGRAGARARRSGRCGGRSAGRCRSPRCPVRPRSSEVKPTGCANSSPVGIAARVAVAGQRAVGGQHLAVGGLDDAALDPLLLEQHAPVVRVVAQRLGLEHRPARREGDQHGEQHQDEPEEADDRRVHRSPLRPIAPAGRRARSETSSSSASRTKLARIDEPP